MAAPSKLADIQSKDEQEKKLILREYRKLLRYLKPSIGNNASKRKEVRHAFIVSADAHKDMRRKTGEPYILHPLAVAQIVVKEIGLGVTSAVAALLHDTVEDTELSHEDIARDFGTKIADIVDGLTKISNIRDLEDTTSQAENFKKILVTLAEDPRVILIKIADRLHNMRTLDSMKREKQLKIASETHYVYAPLAHRLGLYNIKTELEDLSMKYMQTEEYEDIKKKLKDTKKERRRYINEFIRPIKKMLEENNIPATVVGRSKAISSVYNKMRKKQVSFEEVFDIFAIRIIFDTEDDEKSMAWNIYSLITDIYKPRPERLRDWLSQPKSNGYEALHTTVLGPKGRWVEVQIRSHRMDKIAEQGLAAHWRYKNGERKKDNSIDNWLAQIREMLDDPQNNSLDFLQDFKLNLFSKEIYVYSPKGELKVLPIGSTVLDFAFEIHTELGLKCIGGKINFKLVPINQILKTGDQIEIINSHKQKPSENWLGFVKTSKAKSSIKSYFKENKRNQAKQGERIFLKELEQFEIPPTPSNISKIAEYLKFKSTQDLYYGMMQDSGVLDIKGKFDLLGGEIQFRKPKIKKFKSDIPNKTLDLNSELVIFGEKSEKIKYSLARCCQPIPGDEVFGFISLNEGVKIHRTSCPNAPSLLARYGHRIVKTRWNQGREVSFLAGLMIRGTDDMGIIQNISKLISVDMQLNMQSITVDSVEGIFEGRIVLYITDKTQLENLSERLEEIPGVIEVSRFDTEEED